MITGATSGIGKAAAVQLAELGATLVLVGRNPTKTEAVIREVKQRTGNAEVYALIADLSVQQAVRRLAGDFADRYPRLDVLVNNAGAVMLSRQESADGIEMTFAVNHLNYFLLTSMLLDVLRSSSPSRIINVSSSSHHNGPMDFEDLQLRHGYGGYRAYGRSKLANLLFTYELARRLEGTGVTVNGMHPGLVATNLVANNGPLGRLYNLFLRLAGRSVQSGARTITYLASSTDVEKVSGKYFVDQAPVASSPDSYDEEAALRLWRASEELTGLGPSQPAGDRAVGLGQVDPPQDSADGSPGSPRALDP